MNNQKLKRDYQFFCDAKFVNSFNHLREHVQRIDHVLEDFLYELDQELASAHSEVEMKIKKQNDETSQRFSDLYSCLADLLDLLQNKHKENVKILESTNNEVLNRLKCEISNQASKNSKAAA